MCHKKKNQTQIQQYSEHQYVTYEARVIKALMAL